jgi:hypothetical protein
MSPLSGFRSRVNAYHPTRISFVLLLRGLEHMIATFADACFSFATHRHDSYIDMALANMVGTFQRLYEDVPCDFLTIWGNQKLEDRINSAVIDVMF